MADHGDLDHTGITGIPAAITEITDIDTAEMDDSLVLAPDGAGGVEFRAEAGGIADQGAFTYLDATDAAAPANPSAGYARIYSKSGRIYSRDSAGTEYGPFDAGGTGGAAEYNDIVLSPFSRHVIGRHMAGIGQLQPVWNAGVGWQSANGALVMPFVLPEAGTAYKIGWRNGGSVSGNVDIGIYDASGTKIVSAGSTAASGTNARQVVDIADTALSADTLYYLALAADNTSTAMPHAPVNQYIYTAFGCRWKASAFPLPATLTGTAAMPTAWLAYWIIELRTIA